MRLESLALLVDSTAPDDTLPELPAVVPPAQKRHLSLVPAIIEEGISENIEWVFDEDSVMGPHWIAVPHDATPNYGEAAETTSDAYYTAKKILALYCTNFCD